jgi:hypothetical protein
MSGVDAFALLLAQSVPGLLPLSGMFTAFCFMSIVAAIAFFSIINTRPEFEDSLKEENQSVTLVYIPALGWLVGAVATHQTHPW